MLQILVTGGCGFIGSNFIRHLLDGRPAILDGEKIERGVGWRSLIPLDRGLRHTVHWYRSHPDWAREEMPVRRAS